MLTTEQRSASEMFVCHAHLEAAGATHVQSLQQQAYRLIEQEGSPDKKAGLQRCWSATPILKPQTLPVQTSTGCAYTVAAAGSRMASSVTRLARA